MTPEQKAEIDGMDYHDILRVWRFAPSTDWRVSGEAGEYFSARFHKIRKEMPSDVQARISKAVGW